MQLTNYVQLQKNYRTKSHYHHYSIFTTVICKYNTARYAVNARLKSTLLLKWLLPVFV